MKRVFRITIILMPVVVIIAGIGLWRHHYLKIMNAEPEKVFNVPGQPSNLTTDANTSKVKPVKRVDNSDTKTQRIDNRITPVEMDNKGNSFTGTAFGDIIVENLPPEALAALKEYEQIQSTYPHVRRELIPLLKAWPLDENAIRAVEERMKMLKQRRKAALEILAKHSDEAFNELQATIAREEKVAREIAELDREYKERQAVRDAESEARRAAYAASRAETKARLDAADERISQASNMTDKIKALSDKLHIHSPTTKEQEQMLENLQQILSRLEELSK